MVTCGFMNWFHYLGNFIRSLQLSLYLMRILEGANYVNKHSFLRDANGLSLKLTWCSWLIFTQVKETVPCLEVRYPTAGYMALSRYRTCVLPLILKFYCKGWHRLRFLKHIYHSFIHLFVPLRSFYGASSLCQTGGPAQGCRQTGTSSGNSGNNRMYQLGFSRTTEQMSVRNWLMRLWKLICHLPAGDPGKPVV